MSYTFTGIVGTMIDSARAHIYQWMGTRRDWSMCVAGVYIYLYVSAICLWTFHALYVLAKPLLLTIPCILRPCPQ